VNGEFPSAFGEFPIGSQIAGYRLEEQIGRGGMAVVYRAYDIRLDRDVALKILAPALALDDAFRRRFARESKAAAAVGHPNIIPVFDAGEAGGVLLIAMRFVHGPDARTLLEAEGPLSAGRATGIIAQVASALDAAHARGLVHHDVKPANMLLDTTVGGGHRDHVYLSDFGLSKWSFAQLSQADLTSQGHFLGTLDHVAPEQADGRRVDGRADLYALASAAFELLCGTPPFQRDAGLAVIRAKLSEPAPLLSSRRADLPKAIDGVMSRALARKPAERFGNCGEFAAALRDACGLDPAVPEVLRTMPRVATEIAPPVVPAAGPPAAVEPPVGSGGPPARAGGAAGTAAAAAAHAAGGAAVAEPGMSGTAAAAAAGGASAHGTFAEPAPGHPWWHSRAVVSAAAAIVVLGIVGGAFAALHRGAGGAGTGGGSTVGRVTAVIKPPGCTTAAARPTPLRRVRSQMAPLGGKPFGVAVTARGKYSFVSTGNRVAVLSDHGRSLAPTQVATIPAPGANGEALTHDGRYLLAAADSGAYVISVKEAEAGDTGAVLGQLTSPGGMGAVEVSISPDDDFAFITLQDSSEVAVFNLPKSLAGGLGQSGFVGMVPLGTDPVGMAQSPGGRWLYVAQENALTPAPAEGKLYVLSMSTAETDPKQAVRSSATAGCGPARIIVSANGSDVWVTDRESNALVAFSADKLLSNPADSIIARVNVGQTPIGVTFIRGGTEIMVADSNLNHVPGADTVALVSTQRALLGDGSAAVLGFQPSGQTPREFGLEPDGTLLVADNSSGQLQAIETRSLP
jgi:DNA-binding beta-propeller fold protein YncE